MKFKALRSATLLKMTLAKMFWEVLKNTYLRTVATESVKYKVYILLSECCLEEEKE